ncbi:MAG: Na(+)-translocating NADH-quinone reductase subunit A [Desulfopila sp.]
MSNSSRTIGAIRYHEQDRHFEIRKGLDLPIAGQPDPHIRDSAPISRVAIVGDDSIGLKPTMAVEVGDRVRCGQLLFTDKKNPGVCYTAPGCGTVAAINRGKRRQFESLVIELDGEAAVTFLDTPDQPVTRHSDSEIRELLITAGLWPVFRTRPYGKVPAIDTSPSALFVTAIDTEPLAPPPELCIGHHGAEYQRGLALLQRLLEVPIHYCSARRELLPCEMVDDLNYWSFSGPHPAGLASTHIHCLEPVHEKKVVWHIGYQDIIAIGHLFATGELSTRQWIGLGGTGFKEPALVTTRRGASLDELCQGELYDQPLRLISGSVLSGRTADPVVGFLGRFHNQVAALPDNNGRSLFNWVMPGKDRFSIRPVFSSALNSALRLPMSTALWGGKRAIYPLGTYEEVMPLDIIATYLLKAIAVGDTEKAKALGCLELIEEDLALCGFACPGKNEFGPALREVLDAIESEG